MPSLKKKFDDNNTYFEYTFIDKNIPTIFIHGVGLDNTMWYPQKKFFSDKSILFYDILNHGKSKKKNLKLNFKMFNTQLDNLINYLNVKKINLVGFSIGALIAQHYTAINYDKIAKLVLIASIYNRTKEQINIIKNRFKDASEGKNITVDSINRWFTKSYLNKNKKTYDFFFDLLEKKKDSDFLPAYKVFVNADRYYFNSKKINMPTLIITGEKDIGSTPKMNLQLKKKIKKSTLYLIKDAKHGATIEKADNVNKLILNYLFN